ncbi:hypothetical protein BJ508DRAFT_332554 [Ascobolus immersus RN42]|uniref:Uncharacterized protein n=1 Tax=Ascobolus immersus RN42 TaxID=1160509 RepID=A0A3N4HSF2_ASCIM|nr:hypothetical protein BJ508DRAFT_332554 [Ascobolus immersus RN42]
MSSVMMDSVSAVSSSGSDTSSTGSMTVKLLRPNRDGITFQIPNRPQLPVLATLETKLPVATVPGDEMPEEKIIGNIRRKHSVQVDPQTGAISAVRMTEMGVGFTFTGVLAASGEGILAPDVLEFIPNPSENHQASCRSRTAMDPTARGKCFCDIDGEFAPREVLDALTHAYRSHRP